MLQKLLDKVNSYLYGLYPLPVYQKALNVGERLLNNGKMGFVRTTCVARGTILLQLINN